MAHDAGGGGGPDLREGVPLDSLEDGWPLAGQVDGTAAILVRVRDRVFALGATCTHYGGPLAEGLVVDETIRCPWHHACFSLSTGAALAAPALDDQPRWDVEVRDGTVRVRGAAVTGPSTAREPAGSASSTAGDAVPRSVVIVGGGAAGTAAAHVLRREGYRGSIVVVDPDPDAPYDRPNLSKDYLAGTAPEEWLPLRPPEFFTENAIDRRAAAALRIDAEKRVVELADGERLGYDALLLATGAAPVRPRIPGADAPHVLVLRSLADCRALIERVETARRVVVIGAGFIGMEAAASMRQRDVEVTVVAPEEVPFERVLGVELGRHVAALQEEHGVRLRLGRGVSAVEADGVLLDDGEQLPADVILLAVGVRPDTRLAESAGLVVDDGVLVDAGLATGMPGIWAAGDLARFPDPRTGEPVRIEHWVVAERQGQVAARNMLGAGRAFDDPAFFWTNVHGTTVSYVGHARRWDEAVVEGSVDEGSVLVRYLDAGDTAAVATIGRDLDGLVAEAEMAIRWGSSAAGRGDAGPGAGGAASGTSRGAG